MASDKQQLRQQIWKRLEKEGVGAFPFPLEGRIPNFKGSSDAARLLAGMEQWEEASSMKANPDAPQRKARELAVDADKQLFMAVPRLRDPQPFIEIMIDRQTPAKKAVTIKGSKQHGQHRSVQELSELDLIIAGSVAVHPDGRRLGKGGGYSDLEFALARHYGKISDETIIVTTVHPLQIVHRDIPFEQHDIPVDFIITPEEIIPTNTTLERPKGIIPDLLSEKYLEQIPVLQEVLNEI